MNRLGKFDLLGVATVIVAAGFLAAPSTSAQAATFSWQTASGDWGIASNWGGSLPGPADTACIDDGGSASVTTIGPTCGNLSLGDTLGSGYVQMTGGSLFVDSTEYVGNSGTGSFTQSGGTNSASVICLGANAGGSGTYNLNGGLLVASGLTQGNGSAAFNFNGGTFTAGQGFTTNIPVGLNTPGGLATFNTNGYATTLAGSVSGRGGLTKSGDGLLTLLASGGTTATDTLLTFTGGVNVTSGTLQIVNANALFNASSKARAQTISIAAGAVLELDSTCGYFPTYYGPTRSYSNWALGTSGGLTINGNGTLRLNGTGSGSFGLNDYGTGGVVMAMSGGELDIAGGTLFNGALGDTNWTKNKASMNIASGATFLMWDGSSRIEFVPGATIDALTGGGTIDSGVWATAETLTVGINNGSGTFSGVFKNSPAQSGTAIYSLTKTGSGTEALTGANSYSGTTTIAQGVLKLDFSAPGAPSNNIINNTANNSSLVMDGGTLLIQGKPGAINSQQFPSWTVQSGATQVVAACGSGGTVNVSLGQGPTFATGTIDFILPSSGQVTTAPSASQTWPCDPSGNLSAFATVNGGSTWASLALGGSVITALPSYSSTNSLPNSKTGTTLITSSIATDSGMTGVLTFDRPNTTLTASATATLQLYDGGILVTPQAVGTVFQGGTLSGSPNIIDYGSLNMASNIVGGKLVVCGPGTTTLSGSSSTGSAYISGPGTTVLTGRLTCGRLYVTANGRLEVDGQCVGGLYIYSGGILTGTGTINVNSYGPGIEVAQGGHLAPGDGLGKLTLNFLLLDDGAEMDYSLDTPLDSSELLLGTSTATINRRHFTDFNFTPLSSFGPGTYTLIAAGKISGSLAADNSGTIDGYPATLAIQGGNLVLNVYPVPEPSTAALLAFAACAAAAQAMCRMRR